jgi:hypothetical protein
MLLADEQDRILRWAGEYYAGEYVGGYDCFTVGSYGQDEFPAYYCRDVAWGMTDDEMRRKIAHESSHGLWGTGDDHSNRHNPAQYTGQWWGATCSSG